MKAKGLLAAALLLICIPANAECLVTGESCGVGAGAAIVMEYQGGRVLFSQNINKKLPIASTTKIMTALLTLEQPGLDTEFTVDADAIMVEGSSMGLQTGDTVTLRALAAGMLMSSGNDAANAAAVRIAGSIPAFAELMNARASELGMTDSHFVTPSGLDDGEHYSTARDMALLAMAALDNPGFAQMSASRSLEVCFGAPPYQRRLYNHNRLLDMYSGCIGIKTGFTKKSGRCLVSAAQREGVTLICVTLDCGDDWNTHIYLYERYFAMTSASRLDPDSAIFVPVVGGLSRRVEAEQLSELKRTVIQGRPEKIDKVIYSPRFLYAPVNKGDIIGTIVYYIDGKAVAESPLAALSDIAAQPAPEEIPWWKFRQRRSSGG